MISLFSEKCGKVSVGTGMNEGGKGKSALVMRPFTYGQYQLFKNRNNYNVNSGEVLKSFYDISKDVDKYMNCAYVLELTEKLLVEEEPSTEIFRLLLDFFIIMEKRKQGFDTLVLGYQVKLFKLLGMMPELFTCCLCHKKHEPTAFSIEEGGVICEQCMKDIQIHQKDSLIYPIDFGIVEILKYFSLNPLKELKHLDLEQNKKRPLSTIVKEWTTYYLDIGIIKSETFLKSENK